MTDESHLDSRYFISTDVYNCPFCKRRHVSYQILSIQAFDWAYDKPCSVFIVQCLSCDKRSLHLAFDNISHWNGARHSFKEKVDIDSALFYSVPTSFFALDKNIPRIIRELFTEAELCLKSNLLTGASACARKIVYELSVDKEAEGDDYESRIKSLKTRLPHVESAYFDTLLTIQEVTSQKVHERGYDGWTARHLRAILAALTEALQEIYVIPEVRKKKREAILALKAEVSQS